MQRLKYAFRFISRSFQLAKENEALQKPWMVQTLGHFALMILWLLPLALVVGLIGFKPVGLILMGVIIVLLVISWGIWGEIAASGFCQLFDSLIKTGDWSPDSPSDRTAYQDVWADILLLALILPGAWLRSTVRRVFSKKINTQPGWVEARSLIQPVIVLEDFDLKGAAERVGGMVEGNLLRFQAGLMQVNLVARIVEWLLLVLGFGAGLWVFKLIVDPITAGSWKLILGVGVGLLVTSAFGLFGFGFSVYARTCYHTSLYRWVRNVEAAKTTGDSLKAQPPVILAQVLGGATESKKD